MQKQTFLLAAGTAALVSTIIFGRLNDEPVPFTERPMPASTAPVRSSTCPTTAASAPRPAQNDVPVARASEPRAWVAAPASGASQTTGRPIYQRPETSSAPLRSPHGASYRHPVASSQGGVRSVSAQSAGVAAVGQNFAPATAPGGGIGASASPAPALAVELERGVQLPIALLDDEQTPTLAQSAAKRQIAAQFVDQINQAVAQIPAESADLDNVWSSAQARANWEYQKFFGSEAANRASLRAGLEALAKP